MRAHFDEYSEIESPREVVTIAPGLLRCRADLAARMTKPIEIFEPGARRLFRLHLNEIFIPVTAHDWVGRTFRLRGALLGREAKLCEELGCLAFGRVGESHIVTLSIVLAVRRRSRSAFGR